MMFTVATFSLFFALLAVVAEVAVLFALMLWVAGRFSVAARLLGQRVRRVIGPSSLWLAWAVALVSTLGSLAFSEVAHFIPCKLCWYQRICMYPLVILLGVAAWRHRVVVARATLPLIAIGAGLSTYHYLLQRFPSWEGTASCDLSVPCTLTWVWRFNHLSIPAMALSGFALIAVLILVANDLETGTG